MARLLVLNFFPAFHPAASGGELRVGNLYRALANTHDVTLLTSTNPGVRFEELQHQPRFREIRFPKDELWRRAYETLKAWGLEGELSGVAFAMAVSDPSCRLRQLALELAKTADFIVHEFPYSEPIFSAGVAVPEIYNAHNFELSLLSSIIHGPGFDALFLKLMRWEANLAARARYVFATSRVDADRFRLFYGIDPARIALCPNGLDEADMRDVAAARKRVKSSHARPKLLFMGSHHAPNVEAALFLIELADSLPKCDIILAGSVCQRLGDRRMPSNVIRFGQFDAAAKRQLLLDADLFLNPVTAGSGTSLKALEALGAGVPMVATPEGVRGLGLRHLTEVCLAPRQGFAAAIRQMLAGRAQARKIAAAGRALALRDFTWSQSAERFNAHLATAPSLAPARSPIFLALNDYPVQVSNSGGIARIRKLLENSQADTVLVTFGSDYEFVLISPTLLSVTVPKSEAHRHLEDEVNRGESNTANDIAASLFAASSRVLSAITLALARRAKAVIFEHPYMAPLLPALRQLRPDIHVIYSAHNVEAAHKAELLRDHRQGGVLADLVAALESYLTEHAHLILCCTAADAAWFAAPERAVMVAPNGCEVPAPEALQAARTTGTGDLPPRIGFLGSAHGPNIAALTHIVQKLAPAFPELAFEVIGEVCTRISPPVGGNVTLHGVVDEPAKTGIMANWTLALNPVLSGGGSSLKLADYLAHGLVSLNTPAGARGYDITANDIGYVAELAEFGALIRTALSDPQRPQKAGKAYQYATATLSWPVCTRDYRAYLQALPGDFATDPAARSLLVVTDQYAEPAAGEAQIYLDEVLKQLRPRFGRIDLAAIDAARLTRQFHFATRMEAAGHGAAARIAELFDQAYYFAPDAPRDDVMARCRALEGYWTQVEPRLLAPFAQLWAAQDEPLLFGGFYSPEFGDGAVRRWSAPEFALLLPAGSRVLRMRGSGPAQKTLRVTLARIASGGVFQDLAQIVQPIANSFSVSFALPATSGRQPLVVLCQVAPHEAAGDHRPFGVKLDHASVLLARGLARDDRDAAFFALEEFSADLTRDIETEILGRAFQPWITRLGQEALRQSDATAENFDAVHKVHSAALRRWLASAVKRYDVILVQASQSDALPRIREALAATPHQPRVVAMPHFHGAERMDYWRHDLESLAAGPATLLFSQDVADSLRLGERAKIVPAGGVHACDVLDPAAFSRFQNIHSSQNPFFLLIGHANAAQPFARVARAHQALRREGIEVELVLIGPAEAGEPAGETVHALGEQPLDIVHGALSACLAVIDLAKNAHFSEAICKAWLCKKPVIANRRNAAFRDMIRHGDNGLLVGADWELAAAMRHLAADAASCGRLGAAGFAEVHRRYTWPAVAQAVMDVLAG
jgi:glycosyltransferase involved in cell wall biosynthesis